MSEPSLHVLEAAPRRKLNLLQSVPLFARSLLVAGPEHPTLLARLRANPALSVTHATLEQLPGVLAGGQDFDVVIALGGARQAWGPLLPLFAPGVARNGRLLLLLLGVPADAAALERLERSLSQAAASAGLQLYDREGASDAGVNEVVDKLLLVFIHHDYDALQHASQLGAGGHPDWAYDVLTRIPDRHLTSPDTFVNVYAERLLSLLEWSKKSEEEWQVPFASQAQELFSRIVAVAPRFQPAYQCLAEFWRTIHRPDMARRVLTSIQRIAPTESIKRQLATVAGGSQFACSGVRALDPSGGWQPRTTCTGNREGSARPLRVLFVMHPRPHYGLDVLFDGLCQVLGDENVFDLPSKPWLHGEAPTDMVNYPCTSNHRAHGRSVQELLSMLAHDQFDCVLYGDVEGATDQALARKIAACAEVPFFVVDAVDEFVDTRPRVIEYTGRTGITAYFKREMLQGVEYGKDVYPLPFAYPAERAVKAVSQDKSNDFFWAGHRISGLRRLYLEALEQRLGRPLDATMPPEEYIERLRESVIGLNCFGFGFDTVRYWEVPANGCMLLSERLPIHVPHNFVEDESAVFFDDIAELESKLDYYLQHRQDALAIAQAGHAHLLQYHTAAARAGQMLVWLQQYLPRVAPASE
ncbi:MAG: glycosyltransferase [Candidatus Hydrogenedentes bacterium]|nr:glycosyltransferase [Candidatus Hydrogenedentota bacterium]